jgi:hypothetical protein
MTCNERITGLVECARGIGSRGNTEPDRELRAHLAQCPHCRERWDAECQLTAQLRIMQTRMAALQSADSFARRESRESLLRDFSRMHRHKAVPATLVRSWVWALSAAAALVLAVFLGYAAGKRPRPAVSPAVRTHDQTVLYEASVSFSSSFSNDASALSSDDFIAVPYTPPLAPGEMVRVVHADLYPEALASMGVEVDPSWAGELPADVVVGEDGLPRAVRITDNGQF